MKTAKKLFIPVLIFSLCLNVYQFYIYQKSTSIKDDVSGTYAAVSSEEKTSDTLGLQQDTKEFWMRNGYTYIDQGKFIQVGDRVYCLQGDKDNYYIYLKNESELKLISVERQKSTDYKFKTETIYSGDAQVIL